MKKIKCLLLSSLMLVPMFALLAQDPPGGYTPPSLPPSPDMPKTSVTMISLSGTLVRNDTDGISTYSLQTSDKEIGIAASQFHSNNGQPINLEDYVGRKVTIAGRAIVKKTDGLTSTTMVLITSIVKKS